MVPILILRRVYLTNNSVQFIRISPLQHVDCCPIFMSRYGYSKRILGIHQKADNDVDDVSSNGGVGRPWQWGTFHRGIVINKLKSAYYNAENLETICAQRQNIIVQIFDVRQLIGKRKNVTRLREKNTALYSWHRLNGTSMLRRQ